MWTTAQVEALAPDSSSLKSGRELSDARKWSGHGQDERAIWGLCQGSGKNPYQTQVDLTEPAFRCTCPSRKFPCKHGLGLMLLWAHRPESLATTEAPGWVSDWLTGREQRSNKKQERSEKPIDTEAQAKRASQRQSQVQEGVVFLNSWLQDLVRQGLSSVSARPMQEWNEVSARLIDTQAPGLAKMVARIPDLLVKPAWQEPLLEHLGRLQMLVEAFPNEQLSPQLRAEVRTRIGWTQPQEEILAKAGQSDRWWVLGQRAFEDEPVRSLRTWLWGERSHQSALILDFAAGGRSLARTHSLGMALDGELVYFEGATPVRALPKNLVMATAQGRPVGHQHFESLLENCSATLAANPWTEEFPAFLEGVLPGKTSDCLVDSQGRRIPLHYSNYWKLAAISGGHPVGVFGEWDGRALRLLSIWKGDQSWTN